MAIVTDASNIVALLDEYMHLLGLPGEGPIVEVKDNLGSKWLGRTVLRGGRIWIELQARAMADPQTLEKIVAHEMAHYAELSTITEADVARYRHGIEPEHGPRFWSFANKINETKGDKFVTKTSDESYELAENERPFFVVVEKVLNGRFAWRWAAKRTPAINAKLARMVAAGAVLTETTEGSLLSGAKLAKGKIGSSLSLPGSDKEAVLRKLYEEGGGK